MKRLRWLIVLSIVALTASSAFAKKDFCPKVYHKGVIELGINPAFLSIDEYNTGDGHKAEGLTVSSFYNNTFSYNEYAGTYVPDFPPFAADQVGRIMDIGDLNPQTFDFETNFEKLTDLFWGMPNTTWPNEAERVPDGVLPFEAVIIPQGFHAPPAPGRLTIINLDDPNRQEYIVHQSTLDPTQPLFFPPDSPMINPANAPRFYHKAIFYDVNGDGLKDIVTVRSGFKLIMTAGPPIVMPPFSELVWFKNPGTEIDPAIPWTETVLYGGMFAGFMGPDIHLQMYDFEGDGVPEIVATHFFSGDETSPMQPTKGKIVIYGAPQGSTWASVNASVPWMQPRVKMIDNTQGFPFTVEIEDLNADGKVEILATNHQPNCTPYPGLSGKVYVLEQPASGDIFNDDWSVRVLLDGIFPQPTPAGATGMRLAPGHAMTFFPKEKKDKPGKRPWILVSGDEAGKVWIMKPTGHDFDYETAIIFDINDYYGPETTQTFSADGDTISTIGKPAFRYDKDCRKDCKKKGKKHCDKKGVVEIYIPVFEAMDIHVISFDKDKGEEKITCPADVTYECATDPGGGGSTGEECLLEHCMPEVGACMADPTCAGWLGCIQACGDDPMECPTFCGMYFFSPLANDFTTCSMNNGCFEIDFSSFEECQDPVAAPQNLDGMEGTWWTVATSGDDHMFDADCSKFDFSRISETALSVNFSVPLTYDGVDKLCGTPGTLQELADGTIKVAYDNYLTFYENWNIVHKSPNTLLAHICFTGDGSFKNYGTLVLSRIALSSLSAEEYNALDDAVYQNFGVGLDLFQMANNEGCSNEIL